MEVPSLGLVLGVGVEFGFLGRAVGTTCCGFWCSLAFCIRTPKLFLKASISLS